MSHSGCVCEGWNAEWSINRSPSQRGTFSILLLLWSHHAPFLWVNTSKQTYSCCRDICIPARVRLPFKTWLPVEITTLLMFFPLPPVMWRMSLWWMLMSTLNVTALHWRVSGSESRNSQWLDVSTHQSLSIRLNQLRTFNYLLFLSS